MFNYRKQYGEPFFARYPVTLIQPAALQEQNLRPLRRRPCLGSKEPPFLRIGPKARPMPKNSKEFTYHTAALCNANKQIHKRLRNKSLAHNLNVVSDFHLTWSSQRGHICR